MNSPDARPHWRRATLLAVAALLCAALLGSLSAWFLASVALAGGTAAAATFNIHVPGALVRLFAIGRTVAKYGERLIGHRAALEDQVEHRRELFRSMAQSPAILTSGWQLARSDRMADYLDDVEDVDFGRLRTRLPAISGATSLILGVIAAALVAPFSLLPIALAFGALYLLARRFQTFAIAQVKTARLLQRQGEGLLGAALGSVAPLKAEQAFNGLINAAVKPLDDSEAATVRLQLRQSALEGAASATGPVIALSVILAAWQAGARGDLLTPAIFVGFAWLALGDAISGIARIVTARARQQIASAQLGLWSDPAASAATSKPAAAISEITINAWPRLAPDCREIGAPISLCLRAGQPTLLTGVSGSGKTSLLKQIAGWIGQDIASANGLPLDSPQRHAASFFCLHDAAILSDTVRANLFAQQVDDANLWRALELVEMRQRIELAGGLDGWIEQNMLSLGEAQRLNLARALLSPQQIILLDEPIEHLDPQQGLDIVARLLSHWRDRIVVLSTHRDLGQASSPSSPHGVQETHLA